MARFWGPFWLLFHVFYHNFLDLFSDLFLHCFFIDLYGILWILGAQNHESIIISMGITMVLQNHLFLKKLIFERLLGDF